MTVFDVARTDVVTASPDATVADIAATMAEDGVGSVVVVDDGDPVGIVTDRDLALDVLGVGADPAELTARDLMTTGLFIADADDGVFEVIRGMSEVGVRRIPVTKEGELVGIVTLDDFVVLLASELENLAGVIEAESPPYAKPIA